jgi:flagellar protein FliO/FliZ
VTTDMDETLIDVTLPQAAEIVTTSSNFELRYILALVLLGAFIICGLFLVRRSQKIGPRKHSPIKMKILNQMSLGSKKSLIIVDVSGEPILLGVTDHNISMIKSLTLLDEDLPLHLKSAFAENLSQVEKKEDLDKKFQDLTEEEFSITQVKGLIQDKVKNMRPL